LAFSGLKSADAARVKVLAQAAERAGCAAHLGIVHIEESGAAQPEYGSHRPRRWGRYDDDEEEIEGAGSDDFEVIEVSDWRHYVSQWRDRRDEPVAFGEIPLEPGELLPGGALDDEKPDEQRLMEASGNEGASFERSYRRAALVIWRRERFAEVLLQAGVGAALPHLAERIAACSGASGTVAQRRPVIAIAQRIIEVWEEAPGYATYRSLGKEPSRGEMVRLLGRLGDAELLERFIGGVVTRQFDGSECDALAASAVILGPKKSARLFTALARENIRWFHRACVMLLAGPIRELGEKLDASWKTPLGEVAAAIVVALRNLEPPSDPHASGDWWRAEKAKPVDAVMVTVLLESLRVLGASQLRSDAVAALGANSAVFAPGSVIVPALAALHQERGDAVASDTDYVRLWRHAAEFLLARSEHPPAPPIDWRQDLKTSCKCEDCRELQAFALDPVEQVHRFRVRQDRRQHLHQQIEHHSLDMTHVTERKGSPQTLVCTKTQRTFQRQCEQHRSDCASMGTLLDVMRGASGDTARLTARLAAARERRPKS
jgi:hypothetical protein